MKVLLIMICSMIGTSVLLKYKQHKMVAILETINIALIMFYLKDSLTLVSILNVMIDNWEVISTCNNITLLICGVYVNLIIINLGYIWLNNDNADKKNILNVIISCVIIWLTVMVCNIALPFQGLKLYWFFIIVSLIVLRYVVVLSIVYTSINLNIVLLLTVIVQILDIYCNVSIKMVGNIRTLFQLVVGLIVLEIIVFLVCWYLSSRNRWSLFIGCNILLVLVLRLYYTYCVLTLKSDVLMLDNFQILIQYSIEFRLEYCKDLVESFDMMYGTSVKLTSEELDVLVKNEDNLDILMEDVWLGLLKKLVLLEKKKYFRSRFGPR